MELKAVCNPTSADIEHYIRGGQQAAWPHINRIRFMMRTEVRLRQCVLRLKTKLLADLHLQSGGWSPTGGGKDGSALELASGDIPGTSSDYEGGDSKTGRSNVKAQRGDEEKDRDDVNLRAPTFDERMKRRLQIESLQSCTSLARLHGGTFHALDVDDDDGTIGLSDDEALEWRADVDGGLGRSRGQIMQGRGVKKQLQWEVGMLQSEIKGLAAENAHLRRLLSKIGSLVDEHITAGSSHKLRPTAAGETTEADSSAETQHGSV